MNFFHRLFRLIKKENTKSNRNLSKEIMLLIDENVNYILKTYYSQIISEHVNFFVYAVWGVNKNGELTPTQKDINKKIVPVIENILKILDIKGLNSSQKFSLEFIIRGYIISKIAYGKELASKKSPQQTISHEINTLNKNNLFGSDWSEQFHN